jgi:hypothetical protein
MPIWRPQSPRRYKVVSTRHDGLKKAKTVPCTDYHLIVIPNLFAERNLSKSLENAQESSARARL